MAKISSERIGRMMKVILNELDNLGGKARFGDIASRAEPKLELTDYEKETLEKTGYIRWRSFVSFYSINLVKAGYITKHGREWQLTIQGKKALRMSDMEFYNSLYEKYRDWKKSQPAQPPKEPPLGEDDEEKTTTILRQVYYEEAKEKAREQIEDYINGIGAYDFQKLVAELLVGMGYYVPYVASPGPDGGIDIVAYKDPLGTIAPRLRVQVKHREKTKVTVKEVRELEGVLRKEGDMGLIVSSGGFAADAEREIRTSTKHIETMDMDRLILLWQEHYDKIRETGKILLPLVKVYFLAPTEE